MSCVRRETLNATTGLWESNSWRAQPFKTTVDAGRQAVYWHKDMLEDLLAAAVNDAVRKIEKNNQDHMSKMTSGMGLPPGMKLPF